VPEGFEFYFLIHQENPQLDEQTFLRTTVIDFSSSAGRLEESLLAIILSGEPSSGEQPEGQVR